MAVSPKRFSRLLPERLLEVHWRLWSALGVEARTEPAERWVVDLEAAIVSTLAIGLRDLRLLNAMFEWLQENATCVSRARLNRVARVFAEAEPRLLPSVALSVLREVVGDFELKVPKTETPTPPAIRDEWRRVATTFRPREITHDPAIEQPALLQLFLRNLFGMDVRADLFLHLLFSEGGNSLSLSREIYCDQRRIYDILARWQAGGVVVVSDRGYALARKDEWRSLLKIPDELGFLNWSKALLALDRLALLIDMPAGADEYVLSSHFRDLAPEMTAVARGVGLILPNPRTFPGGRYFEPFAATAFKVLEVLYETGDPPGAAFEPARSHRGLFRQDQGASPFSLKPGPGERAAPPSRAVSRLRTATRSSSTSALGLRARYGDLNLMGRLQF